MMQEPLRAFWCRSPSRPNFGDALTPWLIHRLTGRYPVFTRPDRPEPKLLLVGSIIGYASETTTVWGAGILSRHDWVSPSARLLAVRGPLTRRRALQCGARCPEVFGDPALLLPRWYRSRPTGPRTAIGIVPHYFDKHRVAARWDAAAGLRLIDIQRPVTRVIDDICSCDSIVSSSLHGLIVAHAYGIPALWAEFGAGLLGDGSKFRDHFASLGLRVHKPVPLGYGPFEPDALAARRPDPAPLPDLGPLAATCPLEQAG